ncbi:MAG: succinate dehydrogenase assembly factor 2 [Betaproteobacteria bacterium]|nr:succinate dehydrogenase assembly factor 2 [Betaproteobacteria bacterium]
MNPAETNRLRWKCRRGLLELDLVLDRFLRKASLTAGELAALNSLLDLPDNDLWDLIVGRGELEDQRLHAVVARLRAA